MDTYYGDAQGARVEDVVRYDARMPQEQTASMVSQLDGVFSQRQSQAVTTTVIVVGAILTLIGLAGALRPGRGYPGSANSVSGRVPTRRPS